MATSKGELKRRRRVIAFGLVTFAALALSAGCGDAADDELAQQKALQEARRDGLKVPGRTSASAN